MLLLNRKPKRLTQLNFQKHFCSCFSIDSNGVIGQCPPATPPNNSVFNKNFSDANGVYASYYECQQDQVWLSGLSGQISQCVGGNWTQVLDICTEGRGQVRIQFLSAESGIRRGHTNVGCGMDF